MGRCPKDEPTGKSLVCKKALPISEKNWKNLLGGGIHPPLTPLGHRRVKTLPKILVGECGTLTEWMEICCKTLFFINFCSIFRLDGGI